jgi:hypothetical protein
LLGYIRNLFSCSAFIARHDLFYLGELPFLQKLKKIIGRDIREHEKCKAVYLKKPTATTATHFIAKRASTTSFEPALDAIQMEDMTAGTPCDT